MGSAEEKKHRREIFAVFAGLMLAMFVSSLSQTITSTALPTIVGELGGVEHMLWISTAYIMASTIMMPIYGRLGDEIGHKPLLVAALALFMAGSVVCGLADSMTGMIAGRGIQGLGGGGLMILTQAAIADVIPPRERGKYMGVMGSVFMVSMIVGPLLGGFFVEVTGWRWLFWFNVPLIVLAMAAAIRFLPSKNADAHEADARKVDYPGMALMACAVSTLVLTTSWGGGEYAWDSPVIIGLIAICAGSSLLFIVREWKAADPIIPLSLFKNRNFVLCTVSGMLIMVGMMGSMSYLPTYFQIVDGLEPTEAGYMNIPMMIAAMVTSIASGFFVSKTGKYKWLPVISFVIAAAGLVLLSNMTVDTGIVTTALFLMVLGFGMGLGMQLLVLIVQNEFPTAMVGTATAANNFFRQIGSTLGASVVGGMFTQNLTNRVADNMATLDASTLAQAMESGFDLNSITPALVQQLPDQLHSLITLSYNEALTPVFAAIIPLFILGAVIMVFVRETPLRTK